MDTFYDEILISVTELIRDRFSFISIKTDEHPKSTVCTHYFSVDDELIYDSFFNDFGPLNISMLYHYCTKVNKKLKSATLQKKRIVHYSTYNDEKRLNSAYLAASYAIIYLNYTPTSVLDTLNVNNCMPFIDFRDASTGAPYTISLQDCLNAIYKALNFGFFNLEDFDFVEYEYYERVEHGDLNWIVPGKFIGFCGPHNRTKICDGYPLHAPEAYFQYFKRHNVTTIIRLNKRMYDAGRFTRAGFAHKDLYFIDGSTPSDRILNQFITICEKTDGAVAVHCKAGLGRTGSLIGCYMMKHYKFTAKEAIAWIRICRPGSIIGHQQVWLESKESQMWKAGEEYRQKMNITEMVKHQYGIYSYNTGVPCSTKSKTDVSNISKKVDTMQLDDKTGEGANQPKPELTQGDRLNQIKAQRRARQICQPGLTQKRTLRSRALVSPAESTAVLRGSKIVGSNVASTSKITKRIAPTDKTLRRTAQRKTNTQSLRSSTSSQSRTTRATYRNVTTRRVVSNTKPETERATGSKTTKSGSATETTKTVKRKKPCPVSDKERIKVSRKSRTSNPTDKLKQQKKNTKPS